MDPLTAIGLASNIITFVEFSATVLTTAREIYNSTSGDTPSSRSYESIAHQMEVFSKSLVVPDSFSGKDKALCVLAEECRDMATQIQRLLQENRPKDPKSKRQAVWSAIKSSKYNKERLQLQNRLDTCRNQLALQLNGKYCSEIRRNLEALMSTSQEDSNRVVQLQQQVEELRQILEKTHSQDSQNCIKQLLHLSEDSFHALVSQRLIDSLAFGDMYGRFDKIEKAHYNTFKWIFYGDTDPDSSAWKADEITRSVMKHTYDERQDEYRTSARNSFLSWLSSGHGIFHICGKLGSGKSTLMKFLCEDSRTKEALKQWAGDRTLVMANFFFWKPGSKLQKSLDGLLRALLYETLKSLPSLVSKVLPEHWAAMSSTPWQIHTKLELRSETVREAFDRLVDSHMENLAICFFIDGLDEYEETLQEDNLSMVKRLDSWCGNNTGNIKICVSSREYNVFMNHLPSERRIRMQDLTNKDIILYIRDKIEFGESPQQAPDLIDSIASKADGIFLWVALVVKRARELHENGASLEGILEEVDHLPRGLEELFKHILESLEPSDRKRAYQTFAIMKRLQREESHFPLLAYAFIDDYNEQPQGDSTSLPASCWDSKPIECLMTQALKKLRGYCKGLVEVMKLKIPRRKDSGEVEVLSFCHRSVPEFLEPQLQSDGMRYIRSFKTEDAISWLLLAYLCKSIPCRPPGRWLEHFPYTIMKLRHEATLVNEPFLFEEQFEAALARQGMRMPENGYKELLLRFTSCYTGCIASFAYYPEAYTIVTPCLISCYLGHSDYLRWKLDQDPTIINKPSKLELIFFIIRTSETLPDPERRLIFKRLSDGGFSPRTITPTGAEPDTECTVWEHFIVNTLGAVYHYKTMRKSTSTFLELFLESGADAYIAFKWKQPMAECVTLLRGEERRQKLLPDIRYHSLLHFTRDKYSDPDGDGILLTLIDIINDMELENREKLIALVKRNMRIQGANGMEENGDCIVPDATSNVLPELEPNEKETLQE